MAEYKSLAGEPGAHNIGKDAPRPEITKGITVSRCEFLVRERVC